VRRGVVDLFGPGAELDHVGLAAVRIDDVLPGLDRVTDPIQGVTVGFFDLHGLVIEAIEPASDSSPISSQLAKGNRLLHLCYRVPDLQAAIASARSKGLLPLAKPVPAKAFDGLKIAWLFSRTMGLFELLETPREG